ncbi:phosphoenolpyruvate carboxykinase (ATP) [Cardinium endosymbiont of Tipula unca]|uniref:phosphoenolpyruvate carboxykinase (ATP) n=1 Tax=Cardinium endosymbiont of Tipula unca TaxID=3066216 RepID=UPI0030D3ECB6
MSSKKSIYLDLSVQELIEQAVQRGEGVIAANGALSVTTGKRTGRSPQDKFIVKTPDVANEIAWGGINHAVEEEVFEKLWQKTLNYLQTVDTFVSHLQVCADSQCYFPVKIVSEYAWHNLFARQLFIRPQDFHGKGNKQEWLILSAPRLLTEAVRDGTNSDAALMIHLTERKVLLCGHQYAGEIKKAMFSALNYWLPLEGILPMHCAANVGKRGDIALFFGLSGTGKTTLSADPKRYLIGDDEHGWSEKGVFNFEGGCYAKCINLSLEREPIIWKAIRHGAVMENVVINPTTLESNYADARITQNMRVAYPIDFIEKRVPKQRIDRDPEVIIFLTCDLYGVLPPVAYLTQEQAAYYFLSGYTALVGSTEVGQAEAIKATFSTCFGAPFFPRPPEVYASLLKQRLYSSRTQVYLVNTGWMKGSYGEGYRFPIAITRNIIDAILNGHLEKTTYSLLPGFRLAIPQALPGINATLLDPRKNWENALAYNEKSKELITQFLNNAQHLGFSECIQSAGPTFECL